MHRSHFAWLALVALLGLSFAAQKPPKKDPQKPVAPATKNAPPKLEPFIGKLAEARVRAKDRNVPILAHVLLDAEEASDKYRTSVLSDAALLQKSVECLVIIANNGMHPKTKIKETIEGEKKEREVCSMFPMFASCGDHQVAWNDLYAELQDQDGTMHCPQTAVYMPTDGKLTGRINTSQPPSPDEVIAEVVAVQTVAGPGLTDAQLDTVRKALELGANRIAAKAWAEAWKSYATVLSITKKSPYAEEALKNQPTALTGMKDEFTRISALLVPGTAVQGFQEMTAFARDTVGTPLEVEVAARLKKVDTDKTILPEITAWKVSEEADQMLTQARDLYEKKQDKQGERLVRKLLSKKYTATPAAESARKLWPEIAADEAAKNPPK